MVSTICAPDIPVGLRDGINVEAVVTSVDGQLVLTVLVVVGVVSMVVKLVLVLVMLIIIRDPCFSQTQC